MRFTRLNLNSVIMKLGIIAGIAVAILLFVIVYPTNGNPDRWVQFVNSYQTLIGGMLAIFAAVITVGAMIDVDGRQGKRHNELVRLASRADKIRAERLLVPQFEKLDDVRKSISGFDIAVDLFDRPVGDTFKELQERIDVVWRVPSNIRVCLKSDAWMAGEDLFGGKLNDACLKLASQSEIVSARSNEVNDRLSRVRGEIPTVLGRIRPTESEIKENRKQLREAAERLTQSVAELSANLTGVLIVLRMFGREYELELPL